MDSIKIVVTEVSAFPTLISNHCDKDENSHSQKKNLKGGNPAGVVILNENQNYSCPDKKNESFTLQLDDKKMQSISFQAGYSETVFVIPEKNQENNSNDQSKSTLQLRLRYFTPTGEVALCGHATIASMGYIKSYIPSMLPNGSSSFSTKRSTFTNLDKAEYSIMTKACHQSIRFESESIHKKSNKDTLNHTNSYSPTENIDTQNLNHFVWMTQNLPVFGKIFEKSDVEDILSCLFQKNCDRDQNDYNIPVTINDLNMKRCPPRIVSTGLKDIMIYMRNPVVLENLIVDFTKMIELSNRYDVVGFHIFSFIKHDESKTETSRNKSKLTSNETINFPPTDHRLHVVARNFGPRFGINEESATGTSNCAMAAYLHQIGLLKSKSKSSVHCISTKEENEMSENTDILTCLVKQGHLMPKPSPSEIFVQLHVDQYTNDLKKIEVGGRYEIGQVRLISI